MRIAIVLLIGGMLLSVLNLSAQTRGERSSVSRERRLLRSAILKVENVGQNDELTSELKFVSRRVDLNGDGRDEFLVWVPTSDLGGTSGYPIIVFARDRKGFRVLFETGAWTPLIVMQSKRNGWRDIAYRTGGGGAAWQYEVVRFDGKSYRFARTQKSAPKGREIIKKEWSSTTFGPVP